MNNNPNGGGGVGVLGLLGVLFVGLKLTDNIDWSWWWVLSPWLIPLAIIGLALLLLFLGAVAAGIRS